MPFKLTKQISPSGVIFLIRTIYIYIYIYIYFFKYFFFQILILIFVLVIIIIFDLSLHICIFIIHAGYFWLVMAGLKEKFYNLILRFVYITFCLLMEPQTILQEDFDGTDLILL